MVPTHQRLRPNGVTGDQVELRLVVRDELAAPERLGDVGDKAVVFGGVRRLGVYKPAAAARGDGEGGARQQLRGGDRLGDAADGDADGDFGPDDGGTEVDGSGEYPVKQPGLTVGPFGPGDE